MKTGNSIQFKQIVVVLLLFLLACSSEDQSTPVSELPTDVPAPTSAPTTAPTVVPTREPIPTGLIRSPVFEEAVQTANFLAQAVHPARDYYKLAELFRGIQPEEMVPTDLIGTDLEIDFRTNFYINANLGTEYSIRPARLRHLTENAVWWSSVNSRIDDADIIHAATRFEDLVFPTNRLIFGREWSPGIDNDRRVHFLLVQEESWGGFFGYFSRINQFPVSIEEFSNQREMLVINVSAFPLTSETFPGKLAHEYQHLIHWNQDENEELWLNEAMSELAYFLTGSPNLGSAVALSNSEYFALNPEIQLTARPERKLGEQDKSSFMHYGAERAFAIYLLEQYGPEFIQGVMQNDEPGVFSIQQELDRLPDSPRFEDVYANWLVANLLNQPNLDEGQFGYREHTTYLPEREVVNSFRAEPVGDRLLPYGARYYEIQSDQDVQVSFTGSTLARLTPADPPSGQFAWYSNRGDSSNLSITRSFDLSGVDTATLNFKVWFELEEFFDYAYIEVSTDGGESWTILETTHGTIEDPFERAYGVGYTGTSIDWLSESIDISAYAGQEIQVRFEVISDFHTNRDGFQFDDFEIPEIGFFDGAEDDSGGWDARGFVRSSNFVPTEWVVWLIELTRPTSITRIEVSDLQTAEFMIEGFD
jgi:hypothetical protein